MNITDLGWSANKGLYKPASNLRGDMSNMTAQPSSITVARITEKDLFFSRVITMLSCFTMVLISIVCWGFKHLTLLVGFNVVFEVAAMGIRNAGRFASKLLALFSFRGKGTKHTNVQQTIIY